MKSLLLLILLSFFSVLQPLKPAQAQLNVAPQPCDPQFFRQMKSRAWLESEREIMQNQNLIFKADSVLEYTCFDLFANQTAWAGGDIFTHTKYFGGELLIPRGNPYGLEVILTNIVSASLEYYQNGEGGKGSFAHSFLGGRGHLPSIDISPPPGREFELITEERLPYECNVMAEVWKKAKCLNFVHGEEFEKTDGFYPLETLKCAAGADCNEVEGYDVIDETRIFPVAMSCTGQGQGLYNWGEEIEFAENKAEILYVYQEPLNVIFNDVNKRLIPGECTGPIETGIEIILSTGPTGIQDGVCSNPGCTYNGGGCI